MAVKKSKVAAAKKLAAKIKAKRTKKTSSERYRKQGQNDPQSKAWTEQSDESVAAKPVGYRWTTYGAEKLGKNVSVRPSIQDIEKYKNKTFRYKGESVRYLYSERRVDKSDKVRKNKFEDGGEMIGSDIQGAGMFAKGGKVGGMRDRVIDYYLNNDVFENYEYYGLEKADLKDAKKVEKAIIEHHDLNKDRIVKEKFDDLGLEKFDDYAKGGKVGVSGRQYDPYREDIDAEKEAKPAGWRFTDRLAKRLGKSVYTRPTKAEIEKYAGRGVYYERREDKADANPSKKYRSLEVGGEMEGGDIQGAGMFAKGGKVGVSGRQYDPYREDIDAEKEAKPAGWRFTDRLAKRLGKSVYTRPTKAEIEKYAGRGVYYERREDKADANPSKKYRSLEVGGEMEGGDIQGAGMFARGGKVYDVEDFKDWVYETHPTLKINDIEFEEFAEEHYENMLPHNENFENLIEFLGEVDNRSGMFAKGGRLSVSGRQRPNYRKDIDEQKQAKPTGWRFTDRLAKRLGKSAYARPTLADIEKYAGRGVYYERRQDKADANPSKQYRSLEAGGEMEGGDIQGAGMFARGGVARVSNAESRTYTENMLAFKANNLEGKTLENGDYVVLSYGYYPIWYYSKKESKWYGNKDKYSVSTAKHISQSRPTYDATMLGKGELLDKMMDNNARFENGGVLDAILSDAPVSTTTSIGGTQFSSGDLTPQMDLTNPAF